MKKSNFDKLNKIDRRIASLKFLVETTSKAFPFLPFVFLIIASYFIFTYLTKLIVFPLAALIVYLYVNNRKTVRNWFDKNKVEITDKDRITFLSTREYDEYQINKKEEK